MDLLRLQEQFIASISIHQRRNTRSGPFLSFQHCVCHPGTTPSVSSSGNQNGIVWAYEFGQNSQAVLHAYDATNVGNELYNSNQVQVGAAVKFAVPTVCNGKVFVGTANSVAVFGLLSPPPP